MQSARTPPASSTAMPQHAPAPFTCVSQRRASVVASNAAMKPGPSAVCPTPFHPRIPETYSVGPLALIAYATPNTPSHCGVGLNTALFTRPSESTEATNAPRSLPATTAPYPATNVLDGPATNARTAALVIEGTENSVGVRTGAHPHPAIAAQLVGYCATNARLPRAPAAHTSESYPSPIAYAPPPALQSLNTLNEQDVPRLGAVIDTSEHGVALLVFAAAAAQIEPLSVWSADQYRSSPVDGRTGICALVVIGYRPPLVCSTTPSMSDVAVIDMPTSVGGDDAMRVSDRVAIAVNPAPIEAFTVRSCWPISAPQASTVAIVARSPFARFAGVARRPASHSVPSLSLAIDCSKTPLKSLRHALGQQRPATHASALLQQLLPQRVAPTRHEHASPAALHESGAGHAPHSPPHPSLPHTRPAQFGVHAQRPNTQLCPAAHCVPHAPQLRGSLAVFTHWLPQLVSRAAQPEPLSRASIVASDATPASRAIVEMQRASSPHVSPCSSQSLLTVHWSSGTVEQPTEAVPHAALSSTATGTVTFSTKLALTTRRIANERDPAAPNVASSVIHTAPLRLPASGTIANVAGKSTPASIPASDARKLHVVGAPASASLDRCTRTLNVNGIAAGALVSTDTRIDVAGLLQPHRPSAHVAAAIAVQTLLMRGAYNPRSPRRRTFTRQRDVLFPRAEAAPLYHPRSL